MTALLDANLAALATHDATLADQLRAAEPSSQVVWSDSRQPDMPTALVEQPPADPGARPRRITLASRYAPQDEAARLADGAALDKHAVIAVLGLGASYHVAELARRVGNRGHLVVYEPDAALARSVVEHVDCRAWLGSPNVTLLVGEVDTAMLIARLEVKVALISQGVQFLAHPPTRQLHAEALNAFAERFTQFVAFCRTNVATTLVNSARTCRNLADNLAHYAAGPTINELRDAAKGCPAVIVSAGPSLARNVHLLAEGGVRERIVIIAVQTVLKPLLDRGVRPHFVTALDYHEISQRFYEGLPPLDDVTLIAEPKAHRAILDHFPGPIRVCHSRFLNTLLGPHARPVDKLPSGSTVAHLSLYLAQHLGCDPILFIGQDLGFTDGLYYCPGTAIHQVWAPELSLVNTLEMMEWKRIARHKTFLQRVEDIHGQSIYSDDQMRTYLQQFERDFADAPQTIIDATEGGVPKRHTQRMTLAEALERYAQRPHPPLPLPPRPMDPQRLQQTRDLLGHRMTEVRRLAELSRQTLPILRNMMEHQKKPDKMRKLFAKLDANRQQVAMLSQAFELVNELNQVGAFNRIKDDRAIKVSASADEYERQRRQLDRDIRNIEWLISGCEETLSIFDAAASRIDERLAALQGGGR
jgi:hypothetical protein